MSARKAVMATDVIESLGEEIKALPPPSRLRLAADLMEQRRGDIAYPIVRQIADELGAAIALAKLDRAVKL